ncbi:MAG TPA: hypothetical protein VNR60_12555 [Croceibacterium sp.]|nr:hypothetical protein [Croceibacterium sp.]
MKLLRSWTFVKVCALFAAISSGLAIDVPSKVAAEPNLLAVAGVPLVIAALVWLAFAILRYWLLQQD